MKRICIELGALRIIVAATFVVGLLFVQGISLAQETTPAQDSTNDPAAAGTDSKAAPAPPRLPDPKGAQRLSKQYPIWIDKSKKEVIVDGQIALREGMLEMFACTRNTKEHESIVSADTKAYLVHAGLLALGAEPGHPVRFQPEYMPPAGTEIDVFVRWLGENGKEHTARAQDWIKDLKTKKEMTYPFVFAGSLFWVNPDTHRKTYEAEHGDFVCVSNFATAMLDIPVKSSQSNDRLEFEAFTKKIPPLGTPVQLIFKPKLKKPGAGGKGQGAKNRAHSEKDAAALNTQSTGEVK
ncbi:MAG TPA: YdjY domain-containing protein [Lacipirellulaceae bacterium]|nr:YdjY domain-containing protein [Lacipirellulaceae bacterium]